MKKIILSALLLTGLLTNAQIVGSKLVLTNSQATQTFTSTGDRNTKCSVIAAGNLVGTGTDVATRLFNFYDFPVNSFNAFNESVLDIEDRGYMSRLRYIARQSSGSGFTLFDKVQSQIFTVNDDGNNNIHLLMPKANSRVMIGTSSYTDGVDTYSLSVNGSVRADRVKVYNTWADYVFEDGYKLPTLEEVEKHIKEKGHLLDIPSAKEVEAKGIDLGDMNRLLLQKIEELTLYTIELNKQLEQVKAEVKTLKK